MAIRFTEGGVQSYDPRQEIFKKKEKKEERGLTGTTPPKREPSQGEDVAFTRDPKTGKIVFHGAGAEAERTFQQGVTSGLGAGAPATEFEAARAEQAQEELAEQGFFDIKEPERTELDIPEEENRVLGGVQNLPVVGPAISAMAFIIADTLGDKTTFPVETLIQDPVTAREIALQEIQKEVIKQGIKDSEKFGAIIESIPVAGSLVSRYVSGLIETPSGNVNTIVSEVEKINSMAQNTREKAATGKIDPFIAAERLDVMERDVARLAQKIHLLSLASPELRANADALNKIETVILDAKIRINDAKVSAAGGLVAPATDSNIFLTLKELQ